MIVDRRGFLAGAGAGALGLGLGLVALDGSAAAQQPPQPDGGKGGGGEDVAEPQRVATIEASPLKEALKVKREGGISLKTLEALQKTYAGHVDAANALMKAAAAGGQEGEALREARRKLAAELNAVKGFELHLAILGGSGGAPEPRTAKYLAREFGSVERWRADFKACALAAKGFAWLAFDFMTNRLFHFVSDSAGDAPVWDCSPVLAIALAEAAWAGDFKDKAAYVEAWLGWLDWKHVGDRLDVELRCANVPGVD